MFTSGLIILGLTVMSESACEGQRSAKQSQTCGFFFLHCRLYCLCPVFAIHKIRYVQTDHHPERDVIETVLHSEGLTEEERLFTDIIPLLPNQTPCLGHSEMFGVCKRSHMHLPLNPVFILVLKNCLCCAF